MVVTGRTERAASTLQERLDRHSLADRDVGYVRRHGDDLAAELVPQHFPEDARGELRDRV